MKCKICGCEFDESQSTACQSCLTNNCNKVRCPNCGFEQLNASKTESKLLKLLNAVYHHVKS